MAGEARANAWASFLQHWMAGGGQGQRPGPPSRSTGLSPGTMHVGPSCVQGGSSNRGTRWRCPAMASGSPAKSGALGDGPHSGA